MNEIYGLPPKDHIKCECIFCKHTQYEPEIKDKATILCRACSRPYEQYYNGETKISALYYAKGIVTADEDLRTIRIKTNALE